MKAVIVFAPLLLFEASLCFARPRLESGKVISSFQTLKNGDLIFKSVEPEYQPTQDNINLLDPDQWKEMLAQGRVREMLDAIQRVFGSKNKVKVRTQWGGPLSKDIGNTIRNTINWNAYRGDKTNLNIIMDSKFAKNDDKVNIINPNLGLNFQLKY